MSCDIFIEPIENTLRLGLERGRISSYFSKQIKIMKITSKYVCFFLSLTLLLYLLLYCLGLNIRRYMEKTVLFFSFSFFSTLKFYTFSLKFLKLCLIVHKITPLYIEPYVLSNVKYRFVIDSDRSV